MKSFSIIAAGISAALLLTGCSGSRPPRLAAEKEADMGGTFDWFGKESHPDWCGDPETGKYTGEFPGSTPPAGGRINETQFKNRMILRNAMMRHGFKPIAEEWWHFTLADEPWPDTYFNHPVR